MRDLLKYPTVIYDANCIIYYCFQFPEHDINGRSITVTGPYTEKARRITSILVRESRAIATLRAARQEVETVIVAKALSALLEEGFIQRQLKLTGKPTPALKLRMAQKLKSEILKLTKESWYTEDRTYTPRQDRIGAVRASYDDFASNPQTRDRIPPYKGQPSEVDVALILYSGDSNLPLLTNDREIFNFAAELAAQGFCALIKAFPHVSFN